MLDAEITPEVYAQYRQQPAEPDMPALVLIDVREPWEVQTAKLPGAVLMPMGDVPSRAHQELDPDDHIVVLCHHGARSLNVAMWLRAQGFERAQSLAGGIDALVPHHRHSGSTLLEAWHDLCQGYIRWFVDGRYCGDRHPDHALEAGSWSADRIFTLDLSCA